MTTTSAVPAVSPMAGQDMIQASQNLFEHMASQAKGLPAGAAPDQIGANLMERLNGFIERSQQFSGPVRSQASDAPHSPVALEPTTTDPERLGPGQIDRLIGSLSQVFDYSIETQMVVRGATQISGSANTLMRGQ